MGIELEGDHLHIDPIINTDSFDYTIKLNDTPIEVSIRKDNDFKANSKTRYIFDGKETSHTITLPTDQKAHKLEVLL